MSWSDLWGCLLPRSCLLCEAACGAEALCAACAACLPGSRRPRCRACARPWQVSRRCASCRERPPAFEATFAAADYVAPLDRAVTALKFSGRIGLAAGLGGLLADCWREPDLAELQRLDCLVPVPLAAGRQAERGFNQAQLIAAAMLARLRSRGRHPLPVLRPGLLTRHRDTRPQSLLQSDDRQANLDHGFVAAGPAAGLRVGVVDDVMTTGATLQAAALALKAAGARRVVNLVVARTA
jgi:ComF family protein